MRQPPITLSRAAGHFRTISRHRFEVMKNCFRIGLYRQGLTHDLSKYSPTEFLVGARYYTGKESPNNGERRAIGYSSAWLHHKGRNRHHYEYWTDYRADRKNGPGYVPVKMPGRYVAEMFCDRVAASKVYHGDLYRDSDPLLYFRNGRTAELMHPETAELLNRLLTILAEQGENAAFSYIRSHLKKRPLPLFLCLSGRSCTPAVRHPQSGNRDAHKS